ncbi:hypothetical protein ACS0TY_024259 [Phlomoides rotata]
MAIQQILFTLFVALIVSFTYGYHDQLVPHLSIAPSKLLGPIPPFPIASPSPPALPSFPIATSPLSLPPLPSPAVPPVLPSFPPVPPFSIASPPLSLPPLPSQAAPPVLPSFPPVQPFPIASPPPSLPPLPPQLAPPPSLPISISPSLPPLPPLVPSPIASSPYQRPPPPLPPTFMPPQPAEAPPPLPTAFPPPMPPPSQSPRSIKGGYWISWNAASLPPSTIPTSYFTHIFYAFVLVDPTSFQILITPYDEQQMLDFTSSLHAANPPANAMLSIGGAGANSAIFSNMASNSDNRAAFIQSSIHTARKYCFNGLDLDWESPQDPQDMWNLALLYQEWRSAINQDSNKPSLLLSSAVYFSSIFFLPGDVQRTYPGEAIRSYVDFVNPMCYDYHGGWEPNITGAHALLYDKTSNVSTSYGISSWKRDIIQSEKIVMGMPAYGKTWQLKDPSQHGIGAPAVGTGPGGGTMNYTAILAFNSENNATVVFDNSSVSTYSYAGGNWIGYDDTTSVEFKVKYAKDQGLGGYFFWALGFDNNWDLARAASTAWDSSN